MTNDAQVWFDTEEATKKVFGEFTDATRVKLYQRLRAMGRKRKTRKGTHKRWHIDDLNAIIAYEQGKEVQP